MNVTNFSTEERIKLFNEWMNERSLSIEYSFGNEIDFTPEQLNDSTYECPEWGKLPEWISENKLGDKIGMYCYLGPEDSPNEVGVFMGIQATYEDFYYVIKNDSGEIHYHTCVNRIRFINDK